MRWNRAEARHKPALRASDCSAVRSDVGLARLPATVGADRQSHP